MNFDSMLDSVLHNQVVTGLSFTALLGAVAYQLRNLPRLISDGTLRFMTVQLTVTSTDASFNWLDRWLATQPYATHTKMLALRAYDNRITPEEEDTADWMLSPGPGMHMFWWRRRPVFLERRYLSKESDDSRRGKPVEMIKIRTIGRSQAIIRRLITEVREFALSTDTVAIRIWADHYWMNIPGKTQRPLDSIILRDGQMERIINDLNWFNGARQWYRQRGIPYRRGYLFVGKPGVGKTSLVMGLAGYLNRPICVLSLGAVMDDNALIAAFGDAPANAIVVIEDVDCAFPAQSRDTDQRETGKLTKAGLLNAIDGIATPDGRIFIMTSNYPERLDPALIRPGRADVHEHFDYLNPTEQVRMAQRFYDRAFTPVLYPVSPAVLQAVFMLHPTDPLAAHRALIEQTATINT
jgi:chaperone BCS1